MKTKQTHPPKKEQRKHPDHEQAPLGQLKNDYQLLPAVQIHQHFVFFLRIGLAQDESEHRQDDVGRQRFDVRRICDVDVEALSGFGEEGVIAFRVFGLHAQERSPGQAVEVTIRGACFPARICTQLSTEFCRKCFECGMDLQSCESFLESCQGALNAVPHNVRSFIVGRSGNGLCNATHAVVRVEMGTGYGL